MYIKGGSGSFGIYSTKIDNKVRVIDKQELPSWLRKTVKDGNYRTVVTNEEIIVYRSFGHNAEAGGAFATSSLALNRVQTKIDMEVCQQRNHICVKIMAAEGNSLPPLLHFNHHLHS